MNLAPTNPDFWWAIDCLAAGQFAEAQRRFEALEAMGTIPAGPCLALLSSFVADDPLGLELAERRVEAASEQLKGHAGSPGEFYAHYLLARACALVGRKRQSSIKFMFALVTRQPTRSAMLGRALASYESALAGKQAFVGANLERALLLDTLTNERQEAIHAYEETLRYAPNLVIAHARLGTLCNELRLLDQAEKHLERATQLSPSSRIDSVLAGVKLRLGKRDEVKALMRRGMGSVQQNTTTHAFGDLTTGIAEHQWLLVPATLARPSYGGLD